MPARYCEITLDEMRERLPKDKGWLILDDPASNEYIFIFPLRSVRDVSIKVYSSIHKRDDTGRGCGQDAIRVCAVNEKTNRGWIKARRVYRVHNWRENLKVAVLDIIEKAKERSCRR